MLPTKQDMAREALLESELAILKVKHMTLVKRYDEAQHALLYYIERYGRAQKKLGDALTNHTKAWVACFILACLCAVLAGGLFAALS